jgi:DNA processing protein
MALKTEFILTLQQLEGIGNKTILKIAENISSSIETIEELYSFWRTLKGKKFENITKYNIHNSYLVAQQIIENAKKNDVGIMSYYDQSYPDILKECKGEDGKLDPPIILYYRGDISILQKPGIAIIGTREPTSNGIKAGEFFAAEFAKRGYNIVSGLALGCDTTGHKGALIAQGVTTAFLANGLDWESIYPKENLDLAKNIIKNGGLLLSEYAIGQRCGRYGLVARDRLQAGLSYATIVVQTGIKGGTMHAVNATIISGKPLFAVAYNNPQDISHDKVQGNLMLIKNKGASPLSSKNIENALEIIEKYRKKIQQSYTQTTLF